jgi:hypothetical protein
VFVLQKLFGVTHGAPEQYLCFEQAIPVAASYIPGKSKLQQHELFPSEQNGSPLHREHHHDHTVLVCTAPLTASYQVIKDRESLRHVQVVYACHKKNVSQVLRRHVGVVRFTTGTMVAVSPCGPDTATVVSHRGIQREAIAHQPALSLKKEGRFQIMACTLLAL